MSVGIYVETKRIADSLAQIVVLLQKLVDSKTPSASADPGWFGTTLSGKPYQVVRDCKTEPKDLMEPDPPYFGQCNGDIR